MPKFRITWDFDGEEHSQVVERDSLEEAEWQASDNLRDMIYNRTSSGAIPLNDEEPN